MTGEQFRVVCDADYEGKPLATLDAAKRERERIEDLGRCHLPHRLQCRDTPTDEWEDLF